MSEKFKSQVSTAYMLWVFEFADPTALKKDELEAEIKCPIAEIFDSQKNSDRAKKILRDRFPRAAALYFGQYLTGAGFDYRALKEKMTPNEKHFVRHLGKDKYKYLKLLVNLMDGLEETRAGLLFTDRGVA